MKFLLALFALLFVAPQIPAKSSAGSGVGRFALCHDGNYHDEDDIGAITMTEALVWKAGVQSSLVHITFSNHLGASDFTQATAMNASATRAISRYVIPASIIFEYTTQQAASNAHLAAAIDASSSSDKLTILMAGPFEQMVQAFELANPANHRWVTVVSHTTWNEVHEHIPAHRTKSEFFNMYNAGGPFSGSVPPAFVQVSSGNNTAFNTQPLASWAWLNTGTVHTQYVYSRTSLADVVVPFTAPGQPIGDMSDATMLFWYLTGNANASMSNIRSFFGL